MTVDSETRRLFEEFTLPRKRKQAPRPEKPARTHCSKGHELTPENTYEYSNGRARRPTKLCKVCAKAKHEAWRAANPGRSRAGDSPKFRDPDRDRRGWLQRRYGLTVERFEEMWAEQDGRCPICLVELTRVMRPGAGRSVHAPNSAVVDHCHATNVVRGILCMRCNHALGSFRDDADALTRAATYLRGRP